MENYGADLKADLHSHTNYSDGYYSPEELILKAKEAGLDYISITDHDNVDSYHEALEASVKHNIQLIPGTEISAEHEGRETHILAYFINTENEELREYLKNFRIERIKRAESIIEKLNELGIPLRKADVFKKMKGGGSIGRPHIAVAMLEAGFVSSYQEAFLKYIGDNCPAYVKKKNISAEEAIKLINRCGGLSFIAHPGKNLKDSNTLFELIELGVDGIEVIHPSHTETDIEYFRNIAGQYFLLESGGSDFHGGKINENSILGKYFISASKITAMKNRLFI
ncbi:MAG: PHP domain-containing protein [Ignavibacteria bacterium]|nr:PHP domain-containing protein [Ignavibacteria bacterium]